MPNNLPKSIAEAAGNYAERHIEDVPRHSCPTTAHRDAVKDMLAAAYLSGISMATRVMIETEMTADIIDHALRKAAEELNLDWQ